MEARAFQRPDRADFETFADAVGAWLAGFEDSDAAAQFAAAMRRESPAKRIEINRRVAGMDATPDLPNVRCPVLVLHRRGVRTPDIANAQALTASLSDARLVELDGRSPIAPVGDSEPVLRLTTEFESNLAPTAAALTSASAFRTILFTDVVASTPLLAQLKDARMREVMRDHDAVLQSAVDEHGGRVVKEIGDAFMAEFALPSAAIECAIAMQHGIQVQFADSDVPIRLRIGINAGEPIVEDEDLHGASVVVAKRLESAAPENGILVSDVVKQMVMGKEFAFADQGEVVLKGFDEPVRAWAVAWS
jgi:class 3 adenylate cyclase